MLMADLLARPRRYFSRLRPLKAWGSILRCVKIVRWPRFPDGIRGSFPPKVAATATDALQKLAARAQSLKEAGLSESQLLGLPSRLNEESSRTLRSHR
jgi:hypothetical protein